MKNANTEEERRLISANWQQFAIKVLLVTLLDLRLSIVRNIFNCSLSGVKLEHLILRYW